MNPVRRRCREEVGVALAAGLVGGFLFGARESLLGVAANAFVQPGQYFFDYLTVPFLMCMTLGALVVLPVAVLRGLLVPGSGTARSFPLYATLVTFAGGLSIAAPFVVTLVGRLDEVGGTPGPLGVALLWGVALALTAGAAAAVGAGAAWYAARTARPLRRAAQVALALGALGFVPVAHFVATDWKWTAEAPAVGAPHAGGPNVLVISIDTLRADHLGSYGGTWGLTPSLDRLAADGVRCREAITSAPWTLPAVGSLMTARYPRHHGAGQLTNRRDPLGRSALPPDAWTLATALHADGYRTHAVVTNPYLALRYGFGQGFDGYENLTIESEYFVASRDTTATRLLEWIAPAAVIGDRGDTVSARATRWLERTGTSGPFFLWLHYIDPHPPYSRAGVTRHKSFRGDSLLGAQAAPVADLTLTSTDAARLRSGELRLTEPEKDAVRGLYRDEVASVDAAVGRVLDTLDRLGLGERTLVVVVSDHGEEFWEHGGVEHGHTVYEELVHVPLLMRWPGHLPAGKVVEPVVRMTDVAPTILDLLGLPPAPAADGFTMMPLVRGEESAPRVALVENMLFAEERVGLRTPDRKYVRWDTGKEEAYDLVADPVELRDLAAVGPLVTPLRDLHAELEKTLGSRTVTAAAPPRPATAASLRALGYVR